MRIALVGGAGFIGTHTACELREHGHDVVVIDITCVDQPDMIRADACDYTQIVSALDNNFDCVYMFAAISDSAENVQTPLLAVNRNILALANVLQSMHVLKIPKIIFSSTVWVYSVCDIVDVNEETPLPITSSDHIYTTTKLTGEALIRNYSDIYGYKYTILRYGIAYGPGCHPDTVMSKFITNALNNKPLSITGDGSIYRNFLNVRDHARGNRLALSAVCDNHVINLEGPEQITITRVANTVRELHGDVNIEYTSKRSGDYVGKNVCNNKAYRLLNWQPTVMFDSGIKTLYDYIKEKSVNSSTSR